MVASGPEMGTNRPKPAKIAVQPARAATPPHRPRLKPPEPRLKTFKRGAHAPMWRVRTGAPYSAAAGGWWCGEKIAGSNF